MPPRRRSTPTPGVARRPRVAGLAPAAARPATGSATPPATGSATVAGRVPGADTASDSALDTASDSAPHSARETDSGESATEAVPEIAEDELTAVAAAPCEPVGRTAPARGPKRRLAGMRARPVRTLAVALTVFTSLAVGLGVADHLVRSVPSAANTALADVGTTTDVAGQLNSALETVYSYDFTQLDDNERLAREVITPEFAVKFDQLFGQVRQLAPQQQAVVSATVTSSAVQSIEGDRAVLVAFLDQQATRANAGSQPQQLNAAGRLTVIGQRDGDAWKIADVINR